MVVGPRKVTRALPELSQPAALRLLPALILSLTVREIHPYTRRRYRTPADRLVLGAVIAVFPDRTQACGLPRADHPALATPTGALATRSRFCYSLLAARSCSALNSTPPSEGMAGATGDACFRLGGG